MIGIINLELYNSFFNITEENKFELYIFPDEKSGSVSHEKNRDGIGKKLEVANITATDLKDDKKGPIILKEYRE